MRRSNCIGSALVLILIGLCLGSAPARAAVGVNIYGLSWHPSDSETEWFNPGLGLRYQFLHRGRWKADTLVGAYSDSYAELFVHAALGGRCRVAGPVYVGAYFLAGAGGDALDEIWLAPLPALTVEAGPVDLNLHYIPRIKGASDTSSVLGFHVTVWPFGGRLAEERGEPDPDARVALEFGIASGPELTHLDGRTLSLRWTRNRRHAWRFGVTTFVQHSRYRGEEYGPDDGIDEPSETSYDSAEFQLLVQHLWLLPSRRGTRLSIALGPRLDFERNGFDQWAPAVVLGLGAEVDVVTGLSLMAEYTTAFVWRVAALELENDDELANIEAGARLGVALWW